MTLNERILRTTPATLALLCGLSFACTRAEAEERPGGPISMTATVGDATTIQLAWISSAWSASSSPVKFELEESANGVRAAQPEESALSAKIGMTDARVGGTAESFKVEGLQPETNYCFRAWSRFASTGMVSENPSNWACAHTPARVPLAPLDVKASLRTRTDPKPRVAWSTGDQSDHRQVLRFVIERQSPPGANRPWLFEQAVAGPAGAQSTASRLSFSIVAAAIDPKIKNVFRVCAENDGGRTCAEPAPVNEDFVIGTANAVAAGTIGAPGAAMTSYARATATSGVDVKNPPGLLDANRARAAPLQWQQQPGGMPGSALPRATTPAVPVAPPRPSPWSRVPAVQMAVQRDPPRSTVMPGGNVPPVTAAASNGALIAPAVVGTRAAAATAVTTTAAVSTPVAAAEPAAMAAPGQVAAPSPASRDASAAATTPISVATRVNQAGIIIVGGKPTRIVKPVKTGDVSTEVQ